MKIIIIIINIAFYRLLYSNQHNGAICVCWFKDPLFPGEVPLPEPQLPVTLRC